MKEKRKTEILRKFMHSGNHFLVPVIEEKYDIILQRYGHVYRVKIEDLAPIGNSLSTNGRISDNAGFVLTSNLLSFEVDYYLCELEDNLYLINSEKLAPHQMFTTFTKKELDHFLVKRRGTNEKN